MATIYRFIVEQKISGGGGTGRKPTQEGGNKKSPAKKGRMVSIFGGEKGGVEHNRKLRAINPLINRITGQEISITSEVKIYLELYEYYLSFIN